MQSPATHQPPPDRAMGVIKLILGLALVGLGGYLALYNLNREHRTYVASGVILGIILAAGVRLLLTGGAQARGRRFALLPSLAVFIVVGVVVAFTFPRMYKARIAANEQEAWQQLQSSPKAFKDYEAYAKYRENPRRGVLPAMALAEAREELAKPDPSVSQLRSILRRAVSKKEQTGEPEFQAAIDQARQGLSDLYAKSLADLAERLEADTRKREFPEDPQMRAAFAAVLARIAKSDDDWVYLDFTSDSQIKPPPGQAPDPNEISPGESFSPERDSRRRSAFSSAMTESLSTAFKGQTLLRVASLEPAADRKGKVIFQVKCVTRRAPGGFTLTRNDKQAGALFNFEVDWQFSVIDADGKVLATNRSRSNPAGSVSFTTKRDDPDWAPYSVLMDSAYYNYCRQITGRLGLIPPPVKESFTFTR